MKDKYILRLKNNKLLCFYHHNDQNLYCREYMGGYWTDKRILVEHILPDYTVTLSQAGEIYIFCQDIEGSILLITRNPEEENWSRRIILKNQSENIHTILFNPFILKNEMTLLYNIPGDNNTSKLISQKLDNSGTWGQPQQIDTYLSGRNLHHSVQDISPSHYIVFYRANSKESNIGYREIAPDKWSDFHFIYQTGYNITDSSFLTVKDGIHCTMIVKSMFSSQLIYRKKSSGGFTPAQVICESQRMENCLISVIKNHIYITFMSNGQLYMCISENNGISFSRPEPFRQKLCREPVKAIYLSQVEMAENTFFVREVYVDTDTPWDVQFIPEIISFYPGSAPRVENEIEAASLLKRQNEFYNYENASQQFNSLLESNASKDQHLENMSNLLKDRTRKMEETKTAAEKMKTLYMQRINELETKISNLSAENQRLMQEIRNVPQRKKDVIIPLKPKEPIDSIEPKEQEHNESVQIDGNIDE